MKVLIGQTDGLPNIKGFSDWWSYGNGTNKPTGAFYVDNYNNASPTSGNNPAQLLSFDASKYNSIYGNSTYVRMKNLSSKMWLRIS